MDERFDNEQPATAAPAAPSAREYADVGDRVAGILNAAEEAAKQIREDAERAAERTRRQAEREAQEYADARRRRADEDVDGRMAGAAADAEAIRDTAHAAAQRIADEGHRRLEELRTDARALEARFGSTVDDLRDLITQLEHVGLDAAHRPSDRSEADGPSGAAPEPADEADLDEADLSNALWPTSEREEAEAPLPRDDDVAVRSPDGERPIA